MRQRVGGQSVKSHSPLFLLLLVFIVAMGLAVVMLVWVAPDIEEMLKVVDWTTLMFFIAFFMIVGAIQEVGLIPWFLIP